MDWKTVATAFGGILVSGVTWWLSQGQFLATRSEAHEIAVQALRESPYAQDRSLLMEIANRNSKVMEDTSRKVGELQVQVGKLETQVAELVRRIDGRLAHEEH